MMGNANRIEVKNPKSAMSKANAVIVPLSLLSMHFYNIVIIMLFQILLKYSFNGSITFYLMAIA